MPRFGDTSNTRLNTCHMDLQKILRTAIVDCPVDFGIAEGHRTLADQKAYYDQGKSKIDGLIKKGKHNVYPSLAADIYLWINGRASWHPETLTFVMGYITATAHRLWKQGLVKHIIRWGGNWDGDGEILTDQDFDDRPHAELKFVGKAL